MRTASQGDPVAWDRLVELFAGLLWSIARGYGLSPGDAADVVQTAWLRLVENLDRIREPDRIGAWLAATARRECLRLLRRSGRQVLLEDFSEMETPSGDRSAEEVDAALLASERDAALWAALHLLSERCKALLRILMAEPTPSYEEVAAALGMPIGSIGPTRMRCLGHLRRNLERIGISAEAGDS